MRSVYPNFLKASRKVVEQNLQDEGFNCARLAEILKMSRSQIHRKLKAATGLSASDFIKEIRLSRAVDLINNSELSIKEISYEVGIYDPNYFTRIFTKAFGSSPTTYRANIKSHPIHSLTSTVN